VQQHDVALHERGKLLHVVDDRAVGGRRIERDEDCLVHFQGLFHGD
jgi:hypothetical protein